MSASASRYIDLGVALVLEPLGNRTDENPACQSAAGQEGPTNGCCRGAKAQKKGPSLKRQIWFCLASEERGSALVEFAVTVTLLIFLLFAVLQGTFAMYSYHYTAWAAQQGARFAMVRGYTWSSQGETVTCQTSAPPNFTMVYGCTAQSSDIQNYVQSLGAINSSKLTIIESNSYVWPGLTPDGTSTGCTTQANSKGCLVKVTASYTFNFIPFLPASALTMSGTSEKVILQ
jgi:Flp pilus assembly protein TadG